MKKSLLTVIVMVLLLLGTQSQALSSGYSMAVLMDDTVFLAKMDSSTFSKAEADQYSQLVGSLLSAAEPSAQIFYNDTIGDPDSFRSVLSNYRQYYQIIFLDIAAGESRVPSMGANIWMDMYYENFGMYLASLGFPEMLMDMEIQ